MEYVSLLDKKYDKTIKCPNEGKQVKLPQSGVTTKDHGHMVVHGSGAFVVCGMCGAQQPIARI